ncbi:DegT/DnrJ/EryC1/StrS family aminotransferase [Pseudopedobacter saltans]|nr:DegT/DnrJ/EryC1/StrS family aminotransferase [Pseudopedobacter saltans]
MIDLPLEYEAQKSEIDTAIHQVLAKGDFIKGQAVIEFEKSFGEYLNVSSVVSCANGTDALQIALMSLGIGREDEVILPAFSYAAAIEMVLLLGAKPVLVDVDPIYFQIQTEELSKLINSKTKAIIAVHLYGQSADIAVIAEIAEKNNLFLIEDCAQSIGATFTGKHLGTFGDIACTSFFPTKNLGCYGDGGALFTNNIELASRARMVASHGQQKKYDHQILGINSRLDTLQAAILNVKLTYLQATIDKKISIAGIYHSLLQNLEDIIIPEEFSGIKHSWHQYTIKIKNGRRDELKAYLLAKGVTSMIHYPKVLNEHPAFKYIEGEFPVSRALTQEILCLPIHPGLTNEDIVYICDAIKSFYVA